MRGDVNNPQGMKWEKTVRPRSGWFDLGIAELWRYRDLIALFVWRDFVSLYKQTILGPLWFVIQPVTTTLVFTIIFGRVAQLPTDGVPHFLFYLSGVICWKYFSDCLNQTANTFVGNAHIFGKVYFPRLAVPVSVVISNLMALGIQFLLLLAVLSHYWMNGSGMRPQPAVLLLPFLVAQMAALGLGFGIIVSSLTTRYRDLSHLVGFGVQLWMYLTPVVYPASAVPARWRWMVELNPMTSVIETFRFALLGAGALDLHGWLASLAGTATVLFCAILVFTRVEKTFMDTV